MSINTTLSTTSASSTDLLSRSLENVARRSVKFDLADALNVSGKFDTQRQQAQSDLADVQNSVTAAQSADSELGQISDVLNQMSDLVKNGTADDQDFQSKFEALQGQLRSLIGTAAPAGGAAAQALVQQDDNGKFTVTASSDNVSQTIDSAQQEVSAVRSGLASGLAKLHHRAAALQVEYANLDSTVSTLQTESDAASATELAKYALFNQPASALSAQTSGTTGSALKLLQE
jgi:hypothetical protein